MKHFYLKGVLILILLIISSSPSFSQDYVKEKSDSLIICFVTTIDGTELKGKLISEDSDQLSIYDIALGQIDLKKKNIKSIERAKLGTIFDIEMKNGNNIIATIDSIDLDKWKVNSKILGNVHINATDIKNIFVKEEDAVSGGKFIMPNIDPGRYFAGPSPFSLPNKKLIYQNTSIILNGVSYGASKDVVISGGLAAYYIPYVNFKFAHELIRNLHFSLGVSGAGIPVIGIGSSLYGMIGYTQLGVGTIENNFSVGAFYPYYGSGIGRPVNGFGDRPGFQFSGTGRVSERVSLMFESYLIPFSHYHSGSYPTYQSYYTYDYTPVGIIGARIHFKTGSGIPSNFNIGLLFIDRTNIRYSSYPFFAIPALSFTSVLGRKNR